MRAYKQGIVNHVDAMQWTGENLAELVNEGFPLPATIREGYCLELSYGRFDKQTVRPGNYLVKPGNRFDVIPQNVFDQTYVAES